MSATKADAAVINFFMGLPLMGGGVLQFRMFFVFLQTPSLPMKGTP